MTCYTSDFMTLQIFQKLNGLLQSIRHKTESSNETSSEQRPPIPLLKSRSAGTFVSILGGHDDDDLEQSTYFHNNSDFPLPPLRSLNTSDSFSDTAITPPSISEPCYLVELLDKWWLERNVLSPKIRRSENSEAPSSQPIDSPSQIAVPPASRIFISPSKRSVSMDSGQRLNLRLEVAKWKTANRLLEYDDTSYSESEAGSGCSTPTSEKYVTGLFSTYFILTLVTR